jgi:hypothetical protein
MADYFLRSTLNPSKVVKCTVTITQTTPKDNEGETVWIVKAGTPEPHKDTAVEIPPAIVNVTDALQLDEAIRELTRLLAAQIDWGIPVEDYRPPYVYYSDPATTASGITLGVSLYSNVTVSIKDNLPGNGIDKDSITMTVNGFDVTNDVRITGNPFDYTIDWHPSLRIEETDGTPTPTPY